MNSFEEKRKYKNGAHGIPKMKERESLSVNYHEHIGLEPKGSITVVAYRPPPSRAVSIKI